MEDVEISRKFQMEDVEMGVSKNNGTPKSSHFNGVSHEIFTIHFGGFPIIFGSTPKYVSCFLHIPHLSKRLFLDPQSLNL